MKNENLRAMKTQLFDKQLPKLRENWKKEENVMD